MRTVAADCSQFIHSGAQQIIDGLRRAAVAGLDVDDLTEVLKVAFSEDNRIHAALTGAIGVLDAAAEEAPDGELTVRLSCATCLSQPPDQLQLRPRPGPPGAAVALPARHRPGLRARRALAPARERGGPRRQP